MADEKIGRRQGIPYRAIAAGVVAVLIIILIFQNAQRVTVEWYFWDAEVSLSVFTIVVAVLSFAAGWLVARVRP